MNFTEESMQNCELENGKCGTYKGMTYSFIGAFLAAFSLMQFFVFGDGSMAANLKYSLMAWLGFVAATQMGSVYFNYHDKSPGLIFIINTGYNLVGFTLIAVIQALL